jgi:hypothetical protein
VTIILTNLFSGQIYNISDSFASIFILTTVFLGAAVGLVASSWRVLNVDSIQFLHQVKNTRKAIFTDFQGQKVEEAEVFENSAFEEISKKSDIVPGSRLRRNTTTEIREEYL